ncbi:MAG TPA: hypothetical protein VE988_10915 [Gemmataceae bacterium]|nr:hypothetical protein [Gemmataceae bacterium]
MPRSQWPLRNDRPSIQITLTFAQGSGPTARDLLADTGAGNAQASFELLLEESDCLMCGGTPAQTVVLSGAYAGTHPIYLVRVRLPNLGFDHVLPVVGVPAVPAGFDGIACFRFLNRFNYGNYGDSGQFGLEL